MASTRPRSSNARDSLQRLPILAGIALALVVAFLSLRVATDASTTPATSVRVVAKPAAPENSPSATVGSTPSDITDDEEDEEEDDD